MCMCVCACVCLIIIRVCNCLPSFSHRPSGMKHILHTCSTAILEVSLRHRISGSAHNNLLKVRHCPWGFSANMYVQVCLCLPPDKRTIEN